MEQDSMLDVAFFSKTWGQRINRKSRQKWQNHIISERRQNVDRLGYTLAVPITILYNHRLSTPLLSMQ